MAKRGASKTAARPSEAVSSFLASVEHPTRRADALALFEMFSEICGEPARMSGPSIVGFGQYEYTLANGKLAQSIRIGFSPRSANLVVYIMPGMSVAPELLQQLGKHKTGKSCLYINRLSDVDTTVLRKLAHAAWQEMQRRYPD